METKRDQCLHQESKDKKQSIVSEDHPQREVGCTYRIQMVAAFTVFPVGHKLNSWISVNSTNNPHLIFLQQNKLPSEDGTENMEIIREHCLGCIPALKLST